MKRGYLKFWRRAQDSVSWNRGLLYQGLMINLLLRAAWSPATYLGIPLEPGEFGVVLTRLAEELGLSRTNGRRMIAQLETDGFLKVRNVGNRFSVISITNWEGWQVEEMGARSTDGQPNGALAVDRRSTGVATFYNEEEKENKERKSEEGESAPIPESVSGDSPVLPRNDGEAALSADAGLGESGNVRLTRDERASLEARYGADLVAEAIELLDQTIEAKGRDPWRSHAAAMKKWVFDAVRERRARRARCGAAESMPGGAHTAGFGATPAYRGAGMCGASGARGGAREASPLAMRNLATAQAVLRARAREARP